MENRMRKDVRQWRKDGVKRSLTSVFSCLLCAAMLVSSMPMALPVHAQEVPCTQEEHIHGEGCYVQVTEETLEQMVCTVDADVIVHEHTEFCYDAAGDLRCTLTEKKVHTHGEDCLDAEQNLICQKEVLELHKHEADCYDTEGVLVCERAQVVEHVHTEGCFVAETVPVDTEGLTCTVADETHEHGKLCYGTWVLDCDRPEHTHTEACGIAATPSRTSEMPTETTEGATEATGTAESTTPLRQNQEQSPDKSAGSGPLNPEEDTAQINMMSVYRQEGSYPFDDDDERGNDSAANNGIVRTYDTVTYMIGYHMRVCDPKNINVSGYTEGRLHWEFILPFGPSEARFEVGSMSWMTSTGGNYEIVEETIRIDGQEIECQVLRGTMMLKSSDEASQNGIAINADNSRSFAVVVRMLTVPNGTVLKPYFTVWLECNHDFSGNDIDYEKDDYGNPIHTGVVSDLNMGSVQIPHEDGKTYAQELVYENEQLTIKKHTDTIAGLATNSLIVTKKECVGNGEEQHFHAPITCIGEEVVVTAAPRYNFTLTPADKSLNSSKGVYNFSDGVNGAPNAGAGEVEGRLYGFGITIELNGEEIYDKNGNPINKGLLGVELPSGDIELTILLETRAWRGYDGWENVTDDYRPMVWSVGENNPSNPGRSTGERPVDTSASYMYFTPLNRNDSSPAYHYGKCHDGGNWQYTSADNTTNSGEEENKPSSVTVKITDYEINLNQFPYSLNFEEETTVRYYDPTAVGQDFWKIDEAVFSAGELWVVMPYTYTGIGEGKDMRDTLANATVQGNTQLRAWISGGSIGNHSFTNGTSYDEISANEPSIERTVCNTIVKDDAAAISDPFARGGEINAKTMYVEYGKINDANPLTKNCSGTQDDWAVSGQRAALMAEYSQKNREDENRIVGVDILIKFDDAFFEPENYRVFWQGLKETVKEDVENNTTVLWAAKPDKNDQGWNHDMPNGQGVYEPDSQDVYDDAGNYISGYDYEQRTTTPEDLIYFTSLEDLRNAGYTCVGALLQVRQMIEGGHVKVWYNLDGKVKEDAPIGYTYLLTYDCRCWTVGDLDRMWKASEETIPDGVTPYSSEADSMNAYSAYAQTALASFVDGNGNPITVANGAKVNGYGISYTKRIDPCFIRTYGKTTTVDANGVQQVIQGEGKSMFHPRNSKKTTYPEGEYTPGFGTPTYLDACLVVPYALFIEKQTAQMVNGSPKTEYEMGANQKYVDYVLKPSVYRVMGANDSTSGAKTTIDVKIIDVLPAWMTAVGMGSENPEEWNIRWTGQGESTLRYQQHKDWLEPGTLTGGIAPSSPDSPRSGDEQWFEVKYEYVKSAKRYRITITLHNVEISGDGGSLGEIYFTAKIQDDTPGETWLQNRVRIMADDDIRRLIANNGNDFTYSVQVKRNTAISISKVSKTYEEDVNGVTESNSYVERDSINFTVTSANNSGNELRSMFILDSLPVNTVNESSFTGPLVLTEFSAVLQAGNNRLALGNYLTFYYTTSEDFAGYQDENGRFRVLGLTRQALQDETVWTQMKQYRDDSGRIIFSLPTEDKQLEAQITAIVAFGNIPENSSLKMYSSMKLPEGKAGDYLMNYLSQNDTNVVGSSLYTRADVTVVQRSISGKAWYDGTSWNNEGVDHLYGDGDELLEGVKVELLQKNGEAYEPFKYPGSNEAAFTYTGPDGEYLFTDLPAGIFAVRFSSGEQSIYAFTACNNFEGADQTINSDGDPTYETATDYGLQSTLIKEIELPTANDPKMKSAQGNYVSKYNDSGFYSIQYELPLTGGAGTTVYYILGAMLALPALVGLRRRKKG